MKKFLLIALTLCSVTLISCKKEQPNSTKKVEFIATETAVEGSYEAAILGYQVFKVKLDMDKSALITRAKTKDNAVTTLGTWSVEGNQIKVITENVAEYFYAQPNSIVFLKQPGSQPTEEEVQTRTLKKQ